MPLISTVALNVQKTVFVFREWLLYVVLDSLMLLMQLLAKEF